MITAIFGTDLHAKLQCLIDSCQPCKLEREFSKLPPPPVYRHTLHVFLSQGNGNAAIHVAAKLGNVDIARLLIETFSETRDLENKVDYEAYECIMACFVKPLLTFRMGILLLTLPGHRR